MVMIIPHDERYEGMIPFEKRYSISFVFFVLVSSAFFAASDVILVIELFWKSMVCGYEISPRVPMLWLRNE